MESIEQTTDRLDQELQELELLNLQAEDSKSQSLKPKVSKTKPPFCPKTKSEIKDLSQVDAIQYEIDLRKFETEQLKNQLRQINQDEGRTRRSQEARKFIIWGKMVETQIKNRPDRQAAYLQLEDWMTQYLTNDRDRELLGFPKIENSREG
jgi:hypothetical protein